jgi:hypothetical protein
MNKRYAQLLSLLGVTIIIAEICFGISYPSIARSIAFILWLVTSAIAVGAIPQKPRTQQDQRDYRIIGWPMFVFFLALIALCVYAMFALNAPEYLLLIGFLWVLAHLTWKIFIAPTTEISHSTGHKSHQSAPR